MMMGSKVTSSSNKPKKLPNNIKTRVVMQITHFPFEENFLIVLPIKFVVDGYKQDKRKKK
jgi:hypothetical protein